LETGPVVKRWLNVRRDLADVYTRAGIPTVRPNDLRRTLASWMKQQGEDSAVVAKLVGHSSTRMMDLVYGRLNEENYRTTAGRLPSLEFPERGSKWVANPARIGEPGERREGRR
jgi:integrase